MFRTLRPCSRVFYKRNFHTNNCLLLFDQRPRSGFPVVHDKPPKIENISILDRMRKGCYELKDECLLLAGEIREQLVGTSNFAEPNEDVIVWKFDGTEKSLNQWVTTCDSDYKQGFSTAKLELSSCGAGVFHGTLKSEVPKDGVTVRSGYCNITTVRKRKSFKREDLYDWGMFNTLVLKVRGDGRCYMLNILQRGSIDMTWYQMYNYLLYTRGGPYWQYMKIPFSKFVFGSRGVIQDEQQPMLGHLVTNFGITIGDRINGPFKLEIDYIGVCADLYNIETCAYEMCDMSKS